MHSQRVQPSPDIEQAAPVRAQPCPNSATALWCPHCLSFVSGNAIFAQTLGRRARW